MVYVYAADITNLPDPKECPQLLEKLPEERKEKTMCYMQTKGRKQSLGAGLLLQYVLCRHGVSTEKIHRGENGKPEVEGIYFNLSHSRNMVVCAVSHRPVGCDVEKVERAPEKVAERFFGKNEIEYLRNFENEEKDNEFFRLWTMKESYMKMTGEGMCLPLNQFELILEERVKVYREGELCSCFIKEYEIPRYKLTVCAEEAEFVEHVEYVSLI